MLAQFPENRFDRWLRRLPGRMVAGAVLGGVTGSALLLPAGLVALARLLLGQPLLSSSEAVVLGDPVVFVTGYALSFAVGGSVYGALWPFRRTRGSAALGGIATMLPLLLGLGALFEHDWTVWRSPAAWLVATVLAVATGPLLGLQLRDLGQDSLTR